MLKQVFPKEIPSKYVDKLVLTKSNGNVHELVGSAIEGSIPLDPGHESPLSKIWEQDTKSVEIHLNIQKVEQMVKKNVSDMFDKANLK